MREIHRPQDCSGATPCQMPTTLACSWIRKMIPPLPTSLPATGIKRLLPCSMTGIKRDISARTRELTQKTGVQSARQAICSPCFLPIIREHLWNLKAQQDMTLKSFRSGIIPSKTARPTTALSTPLHRIQRTRRRPWKPLITSMAARRS